MASPNIFAEDAWLPVEKHRDATTYRNPVMPNLELTEWPNGKWQMRDDGVVVAEGKQT